MINIEIVGDDKVIAELKSMDIKIHASLLRTITKLSIQLQGNIKADKLSGQVLKTRTGTLRRSINYSVNDTPTSIIGRVGIGKHAAKYGVVHEFGFKGNQNIKAHLRTIKQAFGKAITPKQVSVKSHSRSVEYPEKSFMRTALRELNSEIRSDIVKALQI